MSFYKSKNPALSDKVFANAARSYTQGETMTIQGTVNKTALLAALVFLSAMFTWEMVMSGTNAHLLQPIMIGSSVVALIVAIIIIFRKTTAPYLAPVYCAIKGLALGGISAFMEGIYPGIVMQAILLTFGILFSLLFIYKTGLIKATENFKLMVASATAGIAIFYVISMVAGMFGVYMPMIHEGSTIGIIFSLAVVAIAALNLVIDFDFIENGAESNAPKYMEWYGAFGLMVTIIWLYIEILRLLSKLRSR
ncbi:MAG: Bax inhibitor-1/YccA family protein [Carboxylicivirga sp.]|jgi:uncharacterized YccA/Bax inhibitor family protein|nr:Bax inhibitor-1/YccA family protein [Carboxylicivirga sp.]MCT4645377.1 Bax inhibitor-1/YccA family protein [Carboxylicivirga sp.]